jgi:hypothetical protein
MCCASILIPTSADEQKNKMEREFVWSVLVLYVLCVLH